MGDPVFQLSEVVILNWRSLAFNLLKKLIARKFPTVQSITCEALVQWLESSEKLQPILLDARSEAEYQVSHLQQARRIDSNLPNLAGLAESPQMPIVVYCSVGYRSARVASRLLEAGYPNVYNLEGSIFQWVNEGRPVFQDDRPTVVVHPYNWVWGTLLKWQNRGKAG